MAAFEPIPINYKPLKSNIKINNAQNIIAKNIALGYDNEAINIRAHENSNNPGAYNLFDKNGNVAMACRIGDEIISGYESVDFIKIDVEIYESFVINGLLKTITKYKPTTIFEYARAYHQKTSLP